MKKTKSTKIPIHKTNINKYPITAIQIPSPPTPNSSTFPPQNQQSLQPIPTPSTSLHYLQHYLANPTNNTKFHFKNPRQQTIPPKTQKPKTHKSQKFVARREIVAAPPIMLVAWDCGEDAHGLSKDSRRTYKRFP